MTYFPIKLIFIVWLCILPLHAKEFKTVTEFSKHLEELESPSIEHMVALAPYINGQKFALTNQKGEAKAKQDHKVIFTYLAHAKFVANGEFEEEQKILKAIQGNDGDALKEENITDTQVQIHRAIAMSLFGAEGKDLKDYLGSLYTKDFRFRVERKFGETFFQTMSEVFRKKTPPDTDMDIGDVKDILEKLKDEGNPKVTPTDEREKLIKFTKNNTQIAGNSFIHNVEVFLSCKEIRNILNAPKFKDEIVLKQYFTNTANKLKDKIREIAVTDENLKFLISSRPEITLALVLAKEFKFEDTFEKILKDPLEEGNINHLIHVAQGFNQFDLTEEAYKLLNRIFDKNPTFEGCHDWELINFSQACQECVEHLAALDKTKEVNKLRGMRDATLKTAQEKTLKDPESRQLIDLLEDYQFLVESEVKLNDGKDGEEAKKLRAQRDEVLKVAIAKASSSTLLEIIKLFSKLIKSEVKLNHGKDVEEVKKLRKERDEVLEKMYVGRTAERLDGRALLSLSAAFQKVVLAEEEFVTPFEDKKYRGKRDLLLEEAFSAAQKVISLKAASPTSVYRDALEDAQEIRVDVLKAYEKFAKQEESIGHMEEANKLRATKIKWSNQVK